MRRQRQGVALRVQLIVVQLAVVQGVRLTIPAAGDGEACRREVVRLPVHLRRHHVEAVVRVVDTSCAGQGLSEERRPRGGERLCARQHPHGERELKGEHDDEGEHRQHARKPARAGRGNEQRPAEPHPKGPRASRCCRSAGEVQQVGRHHHGEQRRKTSHCRDGRSASGGGQRHGDADERHHRQPCETPPCSGTPRPAPRTRPQGRRAPPPRAASQRAKRSTQRRDSGLPASEASRKTPPATRGPAGS